MSVSVSHAVPLIRGALMRFTPAPTLTEASALSSVSDEGSAPDAAGEQREPLVIAEGVEALDGAEVVSAIEAFVEQTGALPRRVRLGDGPVLAIGSSLAEPQERVGERLLSDEDCSGRDGVVRGRVAVVTGGAQGFGEQIVRALVGAGARVIIADLNLDGARRLSEELNTRFGPVTRAVRVDVSDESSVSAMMDEVVRIAGGVDLFVSNAGVLKAGSVKELSHSDFELVTRVNYTGFFLCTKSASRVMEAQSKAAPLDRFTDIVQINSKSGLTGSNKNGAYAGSKFGGLGLVQSFAMELVADRIKVNAICPGNFFEGPLWSDPDRGLFVQYLNAGKVPGATNVGEVKAHYEAQVPMGRGCRGEDVARALFYIVEQRYETGQAVPVTGGQIMLS